MFDFLFQTTAIYPNRKRDKLELEYNLNISEFGNDKTIFYYLDELKNKQIFAVGYNRIVYGDHGPYLEFEYKHIKSKLFHKFSDKLYVHNEIKEEYSFYYIWMYPEYNKYLKVYFQLKTVKSLPNAPKREDGKKSNYNRKEGYADYKVGYFYVDPYKLYL